MDRQGGPASGGSLQRHLQREDPSHVLGVFDDAVAVVDARGVNEELRLRPCHAIVVAGQVPQSCGRFHRHRAFPWACGLLLGVEEVEAARGAVVVEHGVLQCRGERLVVTGMVAVHAAHPKARIKRD